MTIDNHTLILEFPELRENIRTQKLGNRRFEECNDLDRQIRRLEDEGSPKADETMEALKKARLALKDERYRMLTT